MKNVLLGLLDGVAWLAIWAAVLVWIATLILEAMARTPIGGLQ